MEDKKRGKILTEIIGNMKIYHMITAVSVQQEIDHLLSKMVWHKGYLKHTPICLCSDLRPFS